MKQAIPKEIINIIERTKSSQLNYSSNLKKIEEILLSERNFVSKPPIKEDVVVLCSGGLDSSVMIQKVIEDWNAKLHFLFFKRGARAEKYEERAYDFFVDFYRKRFPENIVDSIKVNYEIPPKRFKKHFPWELKKTVGHPLRNSTMQNLAVMYAVALNGKYKLNIRTILTGYVGEDKTEPELGLLSLRSQTLNTCINLGDWGWQITSPLTDLCLTKEPIYKTDLIKYAVEKNIPLDKTRTCFSSEEIADGTCFACIKRIKAFEKAGLKDSLEYRIDRGIGKNG